MSQNFEWGYKATNMDMTCKGLQYKLKTKYVEEKAIMSVCGFHAWANPADVLRCYDPRISRFFLVKQSGEIYKQNYQRVSTEIEFIEELTVNRLIEAARDYARNQVLISINPNKEKPYSIFDTFKNYSISQSEGGAFNIVEASDYGCIACAINEKSLVDVSGEGGIACSVTSRSLVSATSPKGRGSIALSGGLYGRPYAKGTIGNAICLVERDLGDRIISVKAGIIDGVNLKENVIYTLRDGEFVEVDPEELKVI